MENKLCENCKLEKVGMVCLQGHVRRIKYEEMKATGHLNIENCHAWEERLKEICWCGTNPIFRTGEYPTRGNIGFKVMFCPECGKPRKEWGK